MSWGAPPREVVNHAKISGWRVAGAGYGAGTGMKHWKTRKEAHVAWKQTEGEWRPHSPGQAGTRSQKAS